MVLAPMPARAADDAWGDDARWVSVRAGSPATGARLAPGSGLDYGFGYTWFLANEVAWSATVQHDVRGSYADAAAIEVPITVEFTKHFRISTPARPYLGAGLGTIYHKTFHTGADESGFRQGVYVATGGNAVLNAGSLIGVDVRLMLEQDTRSINPTFPNTKASSTHWGVKLSYSRVL
jgi:outer membrane protein W